MDNLSFGEKAYSAAKISAVLDALVAEGVSPVGAFGGADVSLDDLHSSSTRISRHQLIQCYRNAAALSRDPHLPYTIGSSVHLSAYGMYGYAMLCSTDFRRTMEFAVRYHQLATPLATIAFHERDRMGVWTIETHISLQRDIMGESFQPREISLRYGVAKDFQITPALVGCPVRFEQPTNQIEFDSVFLDAAPKLGNRTTYPSAIALCDDLIADLVSRSGAAGRVRSLLSTDVAERPSFAAIAKRLKTTPRTLRRQLRLQNTSFRELSDEFRVHAALRYLHETTMTMEDIAFALGFSDSANFRHAFRRWTGKAPQEFRREGAPAA
jgi:AraC-like DNA-binding protein